MPKVTNLYTGRGGQMAVMAEFLMRGYNVAIPEVDIGDDILVVTDRSGEYAKVQVKTAMAVKTRNGYSARYALKFDQLREPSNPETWYVFANRLNTRWESFLVIKRQELYDYVRIYNLGNLSRQRMLNLYISYTGNAVTCSGVNLTIHLNNWSEWPQLKY